MPFSNNHFTNSWLENTYATPLFTNVEFTDFDSTFEANFDAAIGLPDPTLHPWDYNSQQPLTPISDAEDCFTQIPLASTKISTAQFTDVVSTQQNPLKRRSSSIESEDLSITAPKTKRGRPRVARASNSSASSSSGKSNSGRTPHNQVERKYRESLNTEMERLRLAVPSTARWEEGVYCQAGKIKPSKAMVLASAISYIHSLEKEMEDLRRENEMMSHD
jgi:hypothetical protein